MISFLRFLVIFNVALCICYLLLSTHHIFGVRRSVFGNNVGPRPVVPLNAASNPEVTTTSKLLVYEGLQVRAKPLNVTVTPSTLTQPARTPSSPILKAQLSSPSAPTITKKEVKSKVCKSVTIAEI